MAKSYFSFYFSCILNSQNPVLSNESVAFIGIGLSSVKRKGKVHPCWDKKSSREEVERSGQVKLPKIIQNDNSSHFFDQALFHQNKTVPNYTRELV